MRVEESDRCGWGVEGGVGGGVWVGTAVIFYSRTINDRRVHGNLLRRVRGREREEREREIGERERGKRERGEKERGGGER